MREVIVVDDVLAFVRARLDEDETDARDAASRSADWERAETPPARWGVPDPPAEILSGGKLFMTFAEDKGAPLAVAHVLRHDPARVLRGVEAKRRIVAEYEAAHTPDDDLGFEHGWKRGLGMSVEALAAEWSTHTDYRQEWAR